MIDDTEWQKIVTESRKNTQKIANQIFLVRKAHILKQLGLQLNITIEMDNTVKKGRPKMH